MRELRVGWAGMLGRVGEGSLPPGIGTAVAMFPSGWPLPFGCLPFHGTPPLLGCLVWPGAPEMDARDLWLGPPPRALTAAMTACASAPSYGLITAVIPDVGDEN